MTGYRKGPGGTLVAVTDEQITADARALWAVRVLDAWAEQHVTTHHLTYRDPDRWTCDLPKFFGDDRPFYGATPDAARLAAARAVFPELPADVRAKLGECP